MRPLLQTMSAIMLGTAPVWLRIFSKHTQLQWLLPCFWQRFLQWANQELLLGLPLVIGGVHIGLSLWFSLFVWVPQTILWELCIRADQSMVASAVLIGIAIWWLFGGLNSEIGKFEARHLFYCALIGLIVTGLLVWIPILHGHRSPAC